MKNAIRTIVFWYAALTGHDEYPAESGTLKFRFLNWLYDGEAEPMFEMQLPDLPPTTGTPCNPDAVEEPEITK
jgi:hypothetical protein